MDFSPERTLKSTGAPCIGHSPDLRHLEPQHCSSLAPKLVRLNFNFFHRELFGFCFLSIFSLPRTPSANMRALFQSHDSLFSYAVSKPYPYRWFTPLVIVGGIVFLALFSFINVASSGYTLVSEYSTNPNATQEKGSWFGRWPSVLASNARSSCLASTIPINTQLYTNNTALPYTISGVQTIGGDGSLLPSLVYFNNPLQNCSVVSISMPIQWIELNAFQVAAGNWGLDLQSTITCSLAGPLGMTQVNLTSDYNLIPPNLPVDAQFSLIGRNASTKASLYWGESCLSMFYSQLLDVFATAVGPQSKMGLYLFRNASSSNDLSDLDYFQLWERDSTIYPGPPFDKDWSVGSFTEITDPPLADQDPLPGLTFRIGWIRNENSSLPYLASHTNGPNIWPSVDKLAKSFESMILADLGQVDHRPNLLIDPKLLQNYTSYFPEIYAPSDGTAARSGAGPARSDYNSLKDTTGPLQINPSTLVTSYLCQVPHRKPAGELIVSVLVADLVFLQVVWALFTLGVGQWMKRKDPTTHICEGCLARRSFDADSKEPNTEGQEETFLE